MCKKTFVLITLVLVLGLVGSVSATTFYCDPVSGSMSNDGSSGSPWSTLQGVFDNNKIESRDKNLNTINSGAPVKAGDTIKLRSGNHGAINEQGGYHNTSTITVEAQSGHTPKLTRLILDYASNWTFRSIDIAYGMGGGDTYIVEILSGTSGTATHDITIDDCYIYSQEDSSGWTTTEWNNVPSGPRIYGSGNVILQDCTIKNVNMGVHVNANCKVIGCTIKNFAKDGIRGSGSYVVIEDNEILDAYEVNGNHDDGIQWYSYPDATVYDCIIRGNLLMNDTSGGTRNYISYMEGICGFDDNLVNWTVENNIVICAHWHGISLYHSTNTTIANNTAYNPGYIAGENDAKTWITGDDGSGNIVINNLAHIYSTGSNMDVTPTNYTQFFVSTDRSNLDLHLKAGSPAIDAGTSSGAPSVDFDGVSRPQGSGYDVGAYEYITGNQSPVADAGNDQQVTDSDENGSELVSLDGSGSYDNDGSITSYVWKEDSNQIATGVDPDVTLSVGEHTIELTVTDDDSATDTDTVVITVSQPGNLPPVADAGNDQQVTDSDDNGSETIQLDASNSYDTDGSIASYVWKEGGNQIATGVDPNVSFDVGQHTVTLIVTDNNDANDTDTVSVTVNAPWPVTSTSSWQNFGFNSQTGSFTFECDVTPNANNMDGVLALLEGEADTYSDSACRFRFYTNGYLEVLDGSSFYQRDVDISYSTGTSYHLEMDIDISSRTYDVYVTPEGQSKQTLASDYEFAPEQPSVTSLDHWTIIHESGSFDVCDVQVVGGDGDLDAPDPDPMTWSTEPYAVSATSISMTATTATDTSGVEYYFDCTAGGGNDSGWQDSASYTDTGLSVSTQYSYQVKARDKSSNQNETAFSTLKSATTNADTTAPSPDPMTWATDPHSTGTSTISMVATTATDLSGVEYYFDCTAGGGHDSSWQDSTTYVDSGLDPNTQYTYKVKARDKSSNQNETAYSTTKSATTQSTGGPYIDATFDSDADGFTYADITNGSYVDGAWNGSYGYSGGGIRVRTGPGPTGGATDGQYSDDFSLGSAGWVTITLRYRLEMGEGFESNEYGEAYLMIDSTRYGDGTGDSLVRIVGNGNGGGTDDSGWLSGEFDASLSSGSHTIKVGAYNNASTYSDEWVNAYFDNVKVEDANAPGDTTAPSPDPMTWATQPYATGASSISMTATTATDASGVEYYFDCTAGGGNDSGWQDSTTYEDTGLTELTEYSYRVKARDKSSNQNETAYSTVKSATTQDGAAPSPDPMTWATEPYAVSTSSISMTATTATDPCGVEYYFDCTAGGGNDSGWQDSATYTDTGLSELTTYSYRVKARDKSSSQNETAYSAVKSATTQDGTAPSPDPMTWATVPYATGTSSISMTATTATDPCGVEYYFLCTAGGGHDSGWQDSTTYEDTGLSNLTQYSYRVKARDKSSNQNQTGYSAIESATTQDGTAPSPDPMTWATEPYGVSTSSVSMTATTATDPCGVEYYFDCTAGGGNDSGWQDSATYADTGLSEATEYTYRVKARDKSSNQNETAYSTTKSASTLDATNPSPDPMTWATDPYATGSSSISMTATTATDTSGVEYYFDCTAGGGNDSGWQDSATYEDTALSPETQYTYKVQARDKSSNQNETAYSTTKSATTDAAGAEPNLTGWWKLDETSGTTAADSSGNSYNGTVTGATWDSNGYDGGALNFDGTTTYRCEIPTGSLSVSAGTISLWGRLEGTQSDCRYFFGHNSDPNSDANWADSIQLYMDNSDTVLDLGFGGVHPKHANIMTLSTNTWYHIALTWDGTNYAVYVDGVSKASGTYTGLNVLASIADIGNNGNRTEDNEGFAGLIDDVLIYDQALSKYGIADLAGITIASSPSPADNATDVSTTADLSWSAGYYAADVNGHDVYMGTDYNSVADANHSSAEFKGTQSSTTYDPGTLSASTTYYWAIDEVNDSNTWMGDIWSFATAGGDTTAPSPDPMTWATEPNATGTSSIAMTATTATDASGVEYYFDCTAGGGNDSGWQDSTTYENTGLSELTEYTYRVKARDKSSNQNETAYSTTKSATTQDGTAPSPDPMTWATEPNATGTSSIAMTATTATDSSGVEYYFDCTAGGGNDSGWQDSTTYADTGLDPNTQYTYKVKARDKSSNQNETAYSTTKSATTDAAGEDPNLVAWWKFDETSGTSASDSSGNSHTGTLQNGASFTSGYINNAVTFDGDDDRVACGTWNVTGSAITICAWFKATGWPVSSDGRIVSKATNIQAADHTWMLSTTSSSGRKLRFRLKTGGTTTTLIASSGNLSTGTWYHGAAVYNGSTMKLYLDGDEVGSTSKSGSITTSSWAIAIGHHPPNAGDVPWTGPIDDVRIYDRALSESEIEDLAGE